MYAYIYVYIYRERERERERAGERETCKLHQRFCLFVCLLSLFSPRSFSLRWSIEDAEAQQTRSLSACLPAYVFCDFAPLTDGWMNRWMDTGMS